MAQFLSARAPVIDALPKRHHFSEPVVSGARGQSERVTRFPNRLAFNKDETVEFRLLRLCWVVDSTTEAAIDHEASLAFRIHATPRSGARAVASSTLCFPATEDARRVGYRGADSIPRKDQVE